MKWGIANIKGGSGGVSNTMLTTTTDATENSGTYTLALTYLSDTPKVNDYVVYVDSGNLTTLYQVSAVGSTEATLIKVGDVGGGGGKQLYQHNINEGNTSTYNIHIQITNDNPNAMTISDLYNYLIDNDFKGISGNLYDKCYKATGISGSTNIFGVCAKTDETNKILINGNANTSFSSLTGSDKVIPL